MARRQIGQERLAMGGEKQRMTLSLEAVAALVDWTEIDRLLAGISALTRGEPGWSPLALFRALLLAIWHDLSDVGLAGALDDRASFRRFCGFAAHEPTPDRARTSGGAAYRLHWQEPVICPVVRARILHAGPPLQRT